MPLITQIKRRGKNVTPSGGWDYIALSCMFTTAMKEANPGEKIRDDLTYGDLKPNQFVDWSMMPIYYMTGCPLLETGEQVVQENHTYRIIQDGHRTRLIQFRKGDVLRTWRESS